MPTLNRFPLLGLWAEEAARRLGYTKSEAESRGHAYAVLYAIRAQKVRPPSPAGEKAAPAARRKRPRGEQLRFAGDDVEITHDKEGRICGLVGGEEPQTPRTYEASVRRKFPPGYYDKLQKCFRRLLRTYPPRSLHGRLVYNLYDEWKKRCGVGRRVDLDRLLDWCQRHAEKPAPAAKTGRIV